MHKLSLALAAVAALSLAAPAAATTTVISEDFESGLGVFTATGQAGINTGAGYVACCGVTGSAANLANHFVAFGSGDLPSGTLESTTFDLIAGETYTLTFDARSLGSGSDDITAMIGAITLSVITVNNNNLDSVVHMTFPSFIPKSSSTDAIIDNVLLTTTAAAAVPEPASWTMMLLGFAGIGVAMRRRKGSQPIAQHA